MSSSRKKIRVDLILHLILTKWLIKPDVTHVLGRSFRDTNVIISVLFLWPRV